MKTSLLAIQNRLKTISTIKHIDKDWGQLGYEQPPVQFPCALIDMVNADFDLLSENAQEGDCSIVVTLAIDRTAPTSGNSSGNADSYKIFDLIEKVHEKLNQFEGDHFQSLQRSNIKKVYSDKKYEIYTVTYMTQIYTDLI